MRDKNVLIVNRGVFSISGWILDDELFFRRERAWHVLKLRSSIVELFLR